jgi:hypothetical protein
VAKIKLRDALIAWTPTRWSNFDSAGKIWVGPLPKGERGPDGSVGMGFTGGGAFADVGGLSSLECKVRVLSEFVSVVARDGIDPRTAHREFLKIEEYAAAVPPDMIDDR